MVAIKINDVEYMVDDVMFKKYFILCDVETSRFTGVHDYEVCHNGMMICAELCAVIIESINCEFTNNVSDDAYSALLIFAHMYLDHDLFKAKMPRLQLIEELASLREWFTIWPRKELSKTIYHWMGTAIVDSAKKIGCHLMHLTYEQRHNRWFIAKDGMLAINVIGPNIKLCGLLKKFEELQVNIYDIILDLLKIFPEEEYFFGGSCWVIPKYVADGTPIYTDRDARLDMIRTSH